MPSVEKAILNPFEPLSVTEALLVAVCGVVVVFMMLTNPVLTHLLANMEVRLHKNAGGEYEEEDRA